MYYGSDSFTVSLLSSNIHVYGKSKLASKVFRNLEMLKSMTALIKPFPLSLKESKKKERWWFCPFAGEGLTEITQQALMTFLHKKSDI